MKLQTFLLLIVIILSCLFFPALSLAIPANPSDTQLMQPDGSIFSARIIGDEWNNRVETQSGFTIERASDNTWQHVLRFDGSAAVLGDTRADQAPDSGLKQGLRRIPSPMPEDARGQLQTPDLAGSHEASPQGAPIGSFNGPVLFILAEFSDRAGFYSESSWGNFVTNKIADYFNKASYGKVNLSPALETSGTNHNGVVGWVNLGYPHPNTGSSTSTINQQITKDAIIAADPFIDYSSYDNNADNIIDSDELAIVVVVAGFENSFSANFSPSVWSHKWSVGSLVGGAPSVDGVVVGSFNNGNGGYAQFGEIHQSTSINQHQATMGIMVHELGHLIFGLPDLNDPDNSSSGIGAFGLMGGGAWGKSNSNTYAGETPVLPSAWSKLKLGWVDEIEGFGFPLIVAAGYIDPFFSFNNAKSNNTVRKSTTSNPLEFFLAEVRYPFGYDLGLQRWLGDTFGGFAFWHIDETQPDNSSDTNRLVDLEEADGTEMGSGFGSERDLWYRGNKTNFGETSAPNTNLYDGSLSGLNVWAASSPNIGMRASYSWVGPALSVLYPYDLRAYAVEGSPPETLSGWGSNTIGNSGNIPIDYNITHTKNWINIFNGSGSLPPQSFHQIAVQITSESQELVAGHHKDSVTFTNLTTGIGNITLDVDLHISPPGFEFSKNLGGDGYDVVQDISRNRLYVSVPDLNEIVIFSTLTYREVGRIPLGWSPYGIDLSDTKNTLYIALNGSGNVGVLDLDSLSLSTIPVATETGSLLIYDVAEAKPNRIYVSANPGASANAHIALIKTDEGNAVTRVADGRIIRTLPVFLKDLDQEALFIGEQSSPNSLYKLDITNDSAPIILEDSSGTIIGTSHMAIVKNSQTTLPGEENIGSKIILKGGQIIDPSNFSVLANLGSGTPGQTHFSGEASFGVAPNNIESYSTNSFQKFQDFPLNSCSLTEFQRLISTVGHSRGWFAMGDDKICGYSIGNKNRERMPNDFNGDGTSDLLLFHDVGLLGSGLLNSSSLTAFDFLLQVDPAQGWTTSATGDFNGDNKSDILLYNTTTGEYRVIEVNGTTTVSDTVVGIIDPAFGLSPFRMADFDGDGHAEILVHDPTNGFTALLFFNATGGFSSFEFVTLVDVANNWALQDTGDFNGDQNADLVIFNTASREVSIIEMNGSTTGPFTPSFTLDPAVGWTIVDTGDFTGDGRDGILLRSSTGALGFALMKGPLFHSITVFGGVLPGWEIINAGFYDADNMMDLLIFDAPTGNLFSITNIGFNTLVHNSILNLGVGSSWNYHGGKP